MIYIILIVYYVWLKNMSLGDRRTWSSTEDEALRCLVNSYGIKRWTFIAELLET